MWMSERNFARLFAGNSGPKVHQIYSKKERAPNPASGASAEFELPPSTENNGKRYKATQTNGTL